MASSLLQRLLQQQNANAAAVGAEEGASASNLVRRTLRIYGSLYAISIVLFTLFRRWFPSAYNVRAWSPTQQCDLAQQTVYRNPISWLWQVFAVSDLDLHDQCGMDAVCFLRALRFGRKLAILGCVQAVYLIPIYYFGGEDVDVDVDDGNDNNNNNNNAAATISSNITDADLFTKISIDNVPSSSKRLLGTVMATYVCYLYTFYLILQEYKWYTAHRHKFLSETTPRNYAVYVSGIPESYRSSHQLHSYFSQCSKNDAVLEAHIVMDTPKLDKLVARRNQLVWNLQHTLEMERQSGKPQKHFDISSGKTVATVTQLRHQLKELNRSVQRNIDSCLGVSACASGRIRSDVSRRASNLDHLLAAIQQDVDHDDDADTRTNVSRGFLSVRMPTIGERSRNHHHQQHHHDINNNGHSLPPMPDLLSPRDADQVERRAKLGADLYSLDSFPMMADDDSTDAESNAALSNVNNRHYTSDDDEDDIRTRGEGTVVQVVDDDGSLVQAVIDNEGSVLAVLGNNGTSINGQSHYHNNNNNKMEHNDLEQATGDHGGYETSYMQSPIRVANMIRRNLLNGTYMVVGGVGTGLAAAGTGLVAAGTGLAKGGEQIINAVGNQGIETLKLAQNVGQELGATVVNSAGAVVPIILNRTDGTARDAGFVVFKSLYATQMALQMVHHPKPYTMEVTPAPEPSDLFWRNVGLPHQARRSGALAAIAATTALCFFWSIPMSFVTSLTNLSHLKQELPRLSNWVDENPWSEGFLSQLAPLILLFFNEVILPYILKYFATWEGHISTAILEASLFNKLCCFMIIQTFFVSAVAGGVTKQISNIIAQPNQLLDILVNALSAQSTFFIQICLGFTFFMQSIEMLRLYPLTVALLRRCFGPNATKQEQQQVWWWFHPLSEPPDFWHAETFAQLILFYMVFFVYNAISPVVSFFLLTCFILIEAGYRYQFIHNYPRSFDTGGQIWKHFIAFILAIMVIAQLTLIGLLALKKSQYASPGIMPILVVTLLFIFFINNQHVTVAKHLPTRNCILKDSENSTEKEMDMTFVKGEYLQPSLQNKLGGGEELLFPRRNPDRRDNV